MQTSIETTDYMKNKIILLSTLFISLISYSAFAQNSNDTIPESSVDEVVTEAPGTYKPRYTFLPVVAYSQETGLRLGAFGLRQFKPKTAGAETRPSNIQGWVIYSLKNQLSVGIKHTNIFTGEKYFIKGRIAYRNFPELYFGITDNHVKKDTVVSDWTQIEVEERFMKKLAKGLFAGPYVRYFNMLSSEIGTYNTETIPPSLTPDNIPGVEGGITAGLGFEARWDTRDKVLTPTKGHYLEGSFVGHNKAFGSNYTFEAYKIDARKYWMFDEIKGGNPKWFQSSLLAINAYYWGTVGNVPYRQFAFLGGDRVMRGYYFGRYRNNHYAAFQAEWRQHVWWRLGVVAFGGVGNVAPTMEQFDFSTLKINYGTGLRFNINKDDTANIRIDYGLGNDGSSGLIVEFGEAF